MNTCERLKIVRGKLSQAEFAESLGIHKNSLGRYERGESEPDFSVAEKIYTIYGVSPVWLILGVGIMRPSDTPQPAETQVQTPPEAAGQCPRCVKLEERLDRTEEERRELSNENRQRTVKIEQLLFENGNLRERCARLEERQASSN